MVAYQHPAGLNPLQRFRQAGAILKGTSRAVNEAWYRSALDLDLQLHLRVDGIRIDSHIYDRRCREWTKGPLLDEALARDPAAIPSFAEEVIDLARKAGADAMGVILHIADEFATSELKPELDNPASLPELRTTIENDPKSVLDDSSVSATESSWRLIPYPAAGGEAIATTVCISRNWANLLSSIRKFGEARNFPLITRATSAPLISLLALPALKTDELSRPLIAILPYPRFTLLAFFNEHGDLRLLRTLQHRGQRRPTQLRQAVATTAAALELADPEVFLMPSTSEPGDVHLLADLQTAFPTTSLRELDASNSEPHESTPLTGCPELRIAASLAETTESPLATSHTFSILRGEGWATQDFLPVATEDAETFPTRSEMKLLRSARYAQIVFALVALVALTWTMLQMYEMMRQPAWKFDPNSAESQRQRLANLTAERSKIDHWDNLLEDRSKAWTTMELLAELFPEKSGFLVKTFNHSVRSEPSPGQAKSGFVREWKITGLSRDEALERLAVLNTRDGISSIFNLVAKNTDNPSFRTDFPSRSLVVNVRTLENGIYRPGPVDELSTLDEATYPFSFDLTITQRFESSDPMAVTAAAAP